MSENNSKPDLKAQVESAILDIYNGMEAANKIMENPDGDSKTDYKAICSSVNFSTTIRKFNSDDITLNFEVKLL